MSISVFKPGNMAKVYKADPSITVYPRGLISLNQPARQLTAVTSFYFVHLPDEKTTYMVPSPDGFSFRVSKANKGLALNHVGLSRSILEMNGGGQKSIRFKIPNAVNIKIENIQVMAWPLILLRR